jgi:hypothetical protein
MARFAHQESGVTMGRDGIAWFDRLASDLPSQLLRRDLPIAVHEDDERPAGLVLHDQCLDHGVLIDAELA